MLRLVMTSNTWNSSGCNQVTRTLQGLHTHELYVEQCKLVKQAKAALAELDGATSKGERTSKKSSKKVKEAAAISDASEPNLCAIYQQDLEKAREAPDNTKAKEESAAMEMFLFHANLLSVDAKYAWNKVIKEQMVSDPYTDLQGISRKRPWGLLHESFDDCVMFHLLTMFPNNVAEQERYYLTNMLKKPQRISMHQFVQRVELLNAYIAQLPWWLYSPSEKPGMTPANVPSTKADLASHVLQMCLLLWQDQFNLHKKSMTSIDMHLLLCLLRL
jgi:hypothetical protein